MFIRDEKFLVFRLLASVQAKEPYNTVGRKDAQHLVGVSNARVDICRTNKPLWQKK